MIGYVRQWTDLAQHLIAAVHDLDDLDDLTVDDMFDVWKIDGAICRKKSRLVCRGVDKRVIRGLSQAPNPRNAVSQPRSLYTIPPCMQVGLNWQRIDFGSY